MSPTNGLVLSIFPGMDLLGRAFEEAGYTVVRGPDPLWGGDIHTFAPPGGVFEGVIGGPPCQSFSPLRYLQRAHGYEPRHGNLIPEFERVVGEAQPSWWVMENVPNAPEPSVAGYQAHYQIINNRWLGAEQERTRRISFGTLNGARLHLEYAALYPGVAMGAVTSAHSYPRGAATVTSSDGGGKVRMQRYKLPEACRLQGLPEDFLSEAPFTADGKLKAVANGVPLPMGRAIAQAVRRATQTVEASA